MHQKSTRKKEDQCYICDTLTVKQNNVPKILNMSSQYKGYPICQYIVYNLFTSKSLIEGSIQCIIQKIFKLQILFLTFVCQALCIYWRQ